MSERTPVDAMLDLTDALAYVRRLIHEYQAGGNEHLLCDALDRIDRALRGRDEANKEHICACPKCGVTLTVPCQGEIVADVKVGGVKWEACDAHPIRTN